MKNIIIFIGKAWEVEKPVPLGIGGIKNTLAAVRALTKRYSRRQKEEGRRKKEEVRIAMVSAIEMS